MTVNRIRLECVKSEFSANGLWCEAPRCKEKACLRALLSVSYILPLLVARAAIFIHPKGFKQAPGTTQSSARASVIRYWMQVAGFVLRFPPLLAPSSFF